MVEPVVEPVSELESKPSNVIPKIVFIVPYRNRETHLQFFSKHMAYIMEDVPKTDYTFLVIHQEDTRGFNRGAIKNIGFLYVKELYPNDYKNITLVFNDVDTMPKTKNYVNYETTPGIIKHFCGFTYTLGGIVCINAFDFEKINGFPNFWGWGYEDNALQTRAIQNKIIIDRGIFCDFSKDKTRTNFITLSSGVMRSVNKTDFQRFVNKTREGIRSIQNIHYNKMTDMNMLPNFARVNNQSVIQKNGNGYSMPSCETCIDVHIINVKHFNTGIPENTTGMSEYDLRKGLTPFGKIFNRKNGQLATMNMVL